MRNLRELYRVAATAKDGKCEDKDQNLGSAIESGGDNVVVLDKELWAVLAEPPLRTEAKNEIAKNGSVDTDEQPAHIPEDDGEVDVRHEPVGPDFVDDPEGERNEESKKVRDGDPLVASAYTEHVLGNGPGDGKSVELLDVLSRPDVTALDRGEDRSLGAHDGQHHDVVEERTDDAANDLDGVGAPGGQMNVLRELEISRQDLTHLHRVPSIACKVQVGERPAGEHVASKHLADGLQVELEAGHAVLGAEDEHEDRGQNGRDEEAPPGKR